ncbi:MAG: hypothetical protein EOP04_10700 [Proteobacteria bacterium]|nr:MAG: hypothetical protein EOP04_10700 [Pseudomonadota bacterium]
MSISKLVFKSKLYWKSLVILALGLLSLSLAVRFGTRYPYVHVNRILAYTLLSFTAILFAAELMWNWRNMAVAKLLISLGICSERLGSGSDTKTVRKLIPSLKWRKNRSELLVTKLPQRVTLSDVQAAETALANYLRVPVLNIFHEPESQGFVFQIDRCPKSLPLLAILNAGWSNRPHCALIGHTIDNLPIPIDFNRSPILHIAASTGSGKTEACVAIAASMLLNDPRTCREVIIIDPKATSDGKPSAQYKALSILCETLNIPVCTINPDETETEIDDEGKIVKESPTGLIKVRESFARIHREYQKLPSKTSPPDFYYLKICDEASSYLDPSAFASKDKRAISQELCSYFNLWGRLYRSVSWPMISITQSSKSDAISVDQSNLQYKLLGHCGTPQMSINLIGDDRLYRDSSYTRGKFFLIAIPEGYQGPVRTPFGGSTLDEVRKRMKPRSGGGRDAS